MSDLLIKVAVSASLTMALLAAPVRATPNGGQPELTEADAAELILRSLGLLGVEYRFGGNTPASGLDCSGFVRHVYREALGLTLPRRADEMSAIGTPLTRTQLRPGDLVFFNTLGRPFSHVGLYMGEGRFVHAPSTGNVIRVEPLSARYWAQRFEGGRRIPLSNSLLARDQAGLDRLIQARVESAAGSRFGAEPAVLAVASLATASPTVTSRPSGWSWSAAPTQGYLSNH